MPQRYYFISDVHLGVGTREADRERERRHITILRKKFVLGLYRWLHPDVVIPFAERVSKTSRDYTDVREALKKQDGMVTFAQQKIEQDGYDFVVMGHRHHAQMRQFSGGTYINL